MKAAQIVNSALQPSALAPLYRRVRQSSEGLCEPLSDADATVQSMPDASPAKWHLAHTTWFFETMVLRPHLPGYRVFDDSFNFLFNSYYETIGARHPRPKRGMLTRPSLEAIFGLSRARRCRGREAIGANAVSGRRRIVGARLPP